MGLHMRRNWPPLAHQSRRKGLHLVAAPPGGRMHGLLTTLGRGFKKWIGWKRLGIAASVLLIAFSVPPLVPALKGLHTPLTHPALSPTTPPTTPPPQLF